MSYVLDALKKAERERRRQPEMGLDNLEQDDWIKPLEKNSEPRSKKILWLSCLGLGAILVILVLALKPNASLQEPRPTFSPVDTITLNPVPDADELVSPVISEQVFVGDSVSEIEPNLSLSELVEEFRFEGSLVIEGNPEASRVFIDGQAYFVGDYLKDEVYISDISQNSVTLSNGYEQQIHSLR